MSVAGDVDISRAPEIRELGVTSLDDASVRLLIVDLGQVTFMDSTGLGALIALRNAAEERGKQLALRAVSGRVQLLLELTSLTGLFAIIQPSEQAPR